ncbi:uncharacterized protein [Miscanthus floridulus]|uniref:uncharacterized protein n=1 Tax=Miscanthus floridulus TaxID=154761 RepID=UPI00345A1079
MEHELQLAHTSTAVSSTAAGPSTPGRAARNKKAKSRAERGADRTAVGPEGRVRGRAEADGGDDGDHAKSWASIGCTCAVFSSSTSYSCSYSSSVHGFQSTR